MQRQCTVIKSLCANYDKTYIGHFEESFPSLETFRGKLPETFLRWKRSVADNSWNKFLFLLRFLVEHHKTR